MALSSVSVLTSSLALKRYRPPSPTEAAGSRLRQLARTLGRRKHQEVHDYFVSATPENRVLLLQGIQENCGMARGLPCSCNPARCFCRDCSCHTKAPLLASDPDSFEPSGQGNASL